MATIIEFPRTRLTSLHCWTWNGATIEKCLRADVERAQHDLSELIYGRLDPGVSVLATADRLLKLAAAPVFNSEAEAIEHAEMAS